VSKLNIGEDWWSVVLGFALVLVVTLGVLKSVPW